MQTTYRFNLSLAQCERALAKLSRTASTRQTRTEALKNASGVLETSLAAAGCRVELTKRHVVAFLSLPAFPTGWHWLRTELGAALTAFALSNEESPGSASADFYRRAAASICETLLKAVSSPQMNASGNAQKKDFR